MAIPNKLTIGAFPIGIVVVTAFVAVSITSTEDAHGDVPQVMVVTYTFLASGLITTPCGLVPAGMVATTARLWVSTTHTDEIPSVTYARLPSGLTATFWGEDCVAVPVVTDESPISMVETV